MAKFILNEEEKDLLLDPNKKSGDGGWQGLLEKLGRQLNPVTLEIELDDSDLEKIPRYAFDYGQGGWEDQLVGIFSQHLGRWLGRSDRAG